MMRKMPVILLLEIILLLIISPFLPLPVKQALYGLSVSIKSAIVFLLPVLIFGLLFKTMVGLAKHATLIILFILVGVIVSNTVTTFLSHYVGEGVFHLSMSMIQPSGDGALAPSFELLLPKLIANDKAMFLGIILGVLAAYVFPVASNRIAKRLDKIIVSIFVNFLYIIPLFIAGFIIKLEYDDVMGTIVKDYTAIFAIIALTQFTYLCIYYSIANRFNFKKAFTAIRNMIPAAITGFTSMSSAAAMPVTIEGVRENTRNKDLASSIVPATVNIHLIGDCIAIPVFAYAVMKSFGFAEPSFMTYLTFLMYFVLAKFSVAAVPGGGILVMLPVLESTLGFNAEMLSLMTALYILFDPVITCTNIFGNGAFAILIDKFIPSELTKKSSVNESYVSHASK